MTRVQHGPGPIVHGPSLTNPDHYIVELPDSTGPQLMTRDQIAAIPIRHQWFSGTANGLLATWWSQEVAEQHGQQLGVIVGQMMPINMSDLMSRLERLERAHMTEVVLVLCDAKGQPLRGA